MVDIVSVEQHSQEELISKIREVGMLTNNEIKPYKDARIRLVTYNTNWDEPVEESGIARYSADVYPPQTYVLNQNLLTIRDLEWRLKDFDVDLFNLNGYVTTTRSDGEKIDVLPPIIEATCRRGSSRIVSCSDDNTDNIYCVIADGMHRYYLAKMECADIQCILIDGMSGEYPYYAYPITDGFSSVERRSDIPEGFIKKWHVQKNYKDLYRDFNTSFINVGGPRGNFSA